MTDISVPERIAEQARRRPDQIAIRASSHRDPSHVSYRQLVATSMGVADRLRRVGVRPTSTVGVLADTTPTTVAVLLGIWYAGAAYLGLDPGNPPAHTHAIVADAEPDIVVVADEYAQLAPPLTPTVSMSELARLAADPSTEGVGSPAGRYAYVCYTSGTSGTPKGVLTPHEAVTRLVSADIARMGPADAVLTFAPLAFDASTFEIWSTLAAGATLIIPPHGSSTDDLRQVIATEEVTIAWFTAGLFHQIASGPLEQLRGLRVLLAGGDVVAPTAVNRMLCHNSGLTVINGYGPTENTTFSTSYAVSVPRTTSTVPIGHPLPGDAVYVLDDELQPVHEEPGELYVGGPGLADGYLGKAALTAERFIADRRGHPGSRTYRTGDRCIEGVDGALVFLGRVDRQVKIRGVRVEPLEVEQVLQLLAQVDNAVVTAVTGTNGERRLAAFVTARQGRRLSTAAIREHLRMHLPPAAVPATITPLGELPLTRNGKVDHDALARRATAGRPEVSRAFRRPTSPAEIEIATIWADCLGIEHVGVDDDFFELGGHSLLGMQVTAEVSRAFGTRIRSRDFYLAPTVAGLCRTVEARQGQAGS